ETSPRGEPAGRAHGPCRNAGDRRVGCQSVLRRPAAKGRHHHGAREDLRMKRGGTLIIIAVLAASGVARAQRTGVSEEADVERCKSQLADKDYAKAEQTCFSVLRKDTSNEKAWTLYLSTLIAAGKEQRAIEEATRAEDVIGIRNASVFALHGAAILQAAGRPPVDPKTQQPNKWAKLHARALPYLERAVSLNTNEEVALPLLCTYWTLEAHYMERSASACMAAVKVSPNNADILDSLAWIHYNHKRYAEAQTTAEQVIRLRPKAQVEIKAQIVIGLSMA